MWTFPSFKTNSVTLVVTSGVIRPLLRFHPLVEPLIFISIASLSLLSNTTSRYFSFPVTMQGKSFPLAMATLISFEETRVIVLLKCFQTAVWWRRTCFAGKILLCNKPWQGSFGRLDRSLERMPCQTTWINDPTARRFCFHPQRTQSEGERKRVDKCVIGFAPTTPWLLAKTSKT